jgi:cell division septum initiation protein DivIVA
MSAANEERPQFAVAIRGYDRLQVDEYIDRLTEMVSEAEQRAREAEADLEYSRHTSVGPRVAQIFELAVEEVRELREQAAEEAERLRGSAQEEADEILVRVRFKAEELQAELDAELDRSRAAIDELDARKEESIRELRRLQEALSAAAGLVTLESEPAEAKRAA